MPDPLLHCTFCGSPFPMAQGWPKTCSSCKRTSFRNPIPVAVLLLPLLVHPTQPAHTEALPLGLLAIRRGIEPAKGKLALPGGYVDDREDWKVAAARELREEAGIVIEEPKKNVRLFDTQSNPEGDRVLIFGIVPPMSSLSLPPFTPTSETTERVIITAPQEMAFSLHTEVVERFFAQHKSGR